MNPLQPQHRNQHSHDPIEKEIIPPTYATLRVLPFLTMSYWMSKRRGSSIFDTLIYDSQSTFLYLITKKEGGYPFTYATLRVFHLPGAFVDIFYCRFILVLSTVFNGLSKLRVTLIFDIP